MATKIICTVTNDLTYDQRMIRICTTLSEAGYEVLLVGRRRNNSRPVRAEAFQQKRLACFFDAGKLFYLEYNLRLLFFLLFARFQLVCAVDLDTLLPAYIVCKLRRKACVYDAHEYFTEVPEVNRRPMVKKVWEMLADFLIPKVKYAYTVGGCLAEALEKRYGTKFEVIRNMPFQRKTPSSLSVTDAPKIILYQGALNEGRGLEAAIIAMHEIDGAVLWLAGEGDLSEKLRKLVKQERLDNKVTFLGYLPPHKLQELTPKAYIGLNLLENKGLSYYYSLANKAFDYIQAGVPSIHMAFPEYEWLNQEYETYLLLPELSPEQISKAIKELLNNPQQYKRLQQNCQNAAKKLHWEAEAEKLSRYYHSISQP